MPIQLITKMEIAFWKMFHVKHYLRKHPKFRIIGEARPVGAGSEPAPTIMAGSLTIQMIP